MKQKIDFFFFVIKKRKVVIKNLLILTCILFLGQWMYLIPLGFIVMNAMTQAMNMPEDQAGGGQSTSQVQQSAGAVQRGPSSAVRRR